MQAPRIAIGHQIESTLSGLIHVIQSFEQKNHVTQNTTLNSCQTNLNSLKKKRLSSTIILENPLGVKLQHNLLTSAPLRHPCFTKCCYKAISNFLQGSWLAGMRLRIWKDIISKFVMETMSSVHHYSASHPANQPVRIWWFRFVTYHQRDPSEEDNSVLFSSVQQSIKISFGWLKEIKYEETSGLRHPISFCSLVDLMCLATSSNSYGFIWIFKFMFN